MRIALLATGDEIVCGDTLNTNSHALAHVLFAEGLAVGLHLVCGDSEDEIIAGLEFLRHSHDIILITGGLGPTSDDRTRFALAKFLSLQLVEQEKALDHIQQILAQVKLAMNPGNRQQALFPENTTLMPNPYGTAMGGYFTHKGTQFILLPGPPRECLPMFKTYVLPELLKEKVVGKTLLKWRLFGVAEGEIGKKLDDAIAHLNCETGYRLEVPYVEFKVRCSAEEVSQVKHIIEPLVKPHIIAPPEFRASELLRQKIEKMLLTIEIIDDATGGLLQRALQWPGNVQKLWFHEGSGADIYFHITGLDAYWKGRKEPMTQLIIKYWDANKAHSGEVIHEIPYRSPLVLDYATEWLCFRLSHLIDKLH